MKILSFDATIQLSKIYNQQSITEMFKLKENYKCSDI